MKRTTLVECALKASIQVNEENVTKYGYRVSDVQLDKPDRIEIGVSQLHLTTKQKTKVISTFNQLLGSFLVIVLKCQLWATTR